MKRFILLPILLIAAFPSRVGAVGSCATLQNTIIQQWTGVCSAGNYSGSTLDPNYCDNIRDPDRKLHMCRRDDINHRCVAKDSAIVNLCNYAHSSGICEGTCQQDVTITTPTPTEPVETFEPVLPRLQIPIFTLTPFTTPTKTVIGEGKSVLLIDFIGVYLVGLYKFLVGISSITAGVMIVWAGLKWLTSAGNPERISDAKHKIGNASIGLILVLGSYVILNIVNPDLVFFKPLRVEFVERQELTLEESEEEFPTAEEGGQAVTAGVVCNSVDSCRALCSKPEKEWPKSNEKTIPPEQTTQIPTLAGLQAGSGIKATPQMIEKLKTAAGIAQAASGGPYTIKVTSGYRPMSKQIQLVCEKIAAADKGQYDLKKLGTAIAWPGGSNHGSGKAVDVQLLKGTQVLVCSGCFNQQTSAQYAQTAPILADIMFQAGFVRYCKEIWHFELPGTGSPCRSNTCRSNAIGCPS